MVAVPRGRPKSERHAKSSRSRACVCAVCVPLARSVPLAHCPFWDPKDTWYTLSAYGTTAYDMTHLLLCMILLPSDSSVQTEIWMNRSDPAVYAAWYPTIWMSVSCVLDFDLLHSSSQFVILDVHAGKLLHQSPIWHREARAGLKIKMGQNELIRSGAPIRNTKSYPSAGSFNLALCAGCDEQFIFPA